MAEKARRDLMEEAREEGRDFFNAGLPASACRYTSAEFRSSWLDGWEEALREESEERYREFSRMRRPE